MPKLEGFQETDSFSVKNILNFKTFRTVILIFAAGLAASFIGLLLVILSSNPVVISMKDYLLNSLIEPEALSLILSNLGWSTYYSSGNPFFLFILILTNNFLRIILSSIGAVLFWVSVVGIYKYVFRGERENRNIVLYIFGILIFIAEYFIFDDQFTIGAMFILPFVFGGFYKLYQMITGNRQQEPFSRTFLRISLYSIFVAEILTFSLTLVDNLLFYPAHYSSLTDWFVGLAPHIAIEIIGIVIGCTIGYFIAADMNQALDEDGLDGFLEEGQALLVNSKVWMAVGLSLFLFLIGALVEAYFSIAVVQANYGTFIYTSVGDFIWAILVNFAPIILIIGLIYMLGRKSRYWALAKVFIYIFSVEGFFYIFTFLQAPIVAYNVNPVVQSMGFHFFVTSCYFVGESFQDFGTFSLLVFFVVLFTIIMDFRKKITYTGSIRNPLRKKGLLDPFSQENFGALKSTIYNGMWPLLPMILLAVNSSGSPYFGLFELNILLYIFLVWRFRSGISDSLELKTKPREIDENGNILLEPKKRSAWMNAMMKLYYVGMFLFNIASIVMLVLSGADLQLIFFYSLFFTKQLILAILILPFLVTFGSILLIKAMNFLKKIDFRPNRITRAFIYAVPMSIFTVGLLIGASIVTNLILLIPILIINPSAFPNPVYALFTFEWALGFAEAWQDFYLQYYILGINLWITFSTVFYFGIFIVIGLIAAKIAKKKNIPKEYLVLLTMCLSFPLMWILLPSTHFLVEPPFMALVYSGANHVLAPLFFPETPAVPATLIMLPLLLLNSAMAGLLGFIIFVPIFFVVTIQSVLTILPIGEQILSTIYTFMKDYYLYYYNFIFLLNFSLFFAGAIMISYYFFYASKKKRRKKRTWTSF